MSEQTLESKSGVTSVPNSDTQTIPANAFSQSDQPKSRWWIWVLALIVLGVGGLLYYQRQSAGESSKAKAAPAPRAVPITTAPAKEGDIGVYVEALGTVTPVYTDTITSRVQGEIMDVHYKEGQMVSKGDPLLEICLLYTSPSPRD